MSPVDGILAKAVRALRPKMPGCAHMLQAGVPAILCAHHPSVLRCEECHGAHEAAHDLALAGTCDECGAVAVPPDEGGRAFCPAPLIVSGVRRVAVGRGREVVVPTTLILGAACCLACGGCGDVTAPLYVPASPPDR